LTTDLATQTLRAFATVPSLEIMPRPADIRAQSRRREFATFK